MAAVHAPGKGQGNKWKHGLFGCFSRCGTCCYGYWCTPCLYGQNVKDMGEGNCVTNCLIYYCLAGFGCCCLVHMQTRKRLRGKYGLEEEPCGDCCVTTFCCPCAVCQEANELEHQATVPHGGVYHGTQMTPPQQQQFGGPQVAQHQQQYPPQYPPASGAAPPGYQPQY